MAAQPDWGGIEPDLNMPRSRVGQAPMAENSLIPGTSTDQGQPTSTAADARRLVRCSMTAALATLDQATGHPYASLVLVATTAAGAPILLMSRLARHTRNLRADTRASLLFDGTSGSADPLAGGRVTLIGHIAPCDGAGVRDRFLARHPTAADYVDFADFDFYALTAEKAHFIGGFGRIVELPASDLLIDITDAGPLLDAARDILAHMNGPRADVVALYATQLLGQAADAWRMAGIDPEGADLLAGTRAARLAFTRRVLTPDDARGELAHLASAARGPSPARPEALT